MSLSILINNTSNKIYLKELQFVLSLIRIDRLVEKLFDFKNAPFFYS